MLYFCRKKHQLTILHKKLAHTCTDTRTVHRMKHRASTCYPDISGILVFRRFDFQQKTKSIDLALVTSTNLTSAKLLIDLLVTSTNLTSAKLLIDLLVTSTNLWTDFAQVS